MSWRRIAVCLQVTPKQTFASALDWPSGCRAGRDEGAALEALTSYAERYAPVAEQAGVGFPSTVAFDVVERVPSRPRPRLPHPNAARSRRCPPRPSGRRWTRPRPGAWSAWSPRAWATFDEVAAASPAELRRGPRGGGRAGTSSSTAWSVPVGLRAQARGEARTAGNRRHRCDREAARGNRQWWAPLSTVQPSYPTAGPRATRPAESPGTSSNVPGDAGSSGAEVVEPGRR
jgi:hypothetical protein